MAEESFVPVSAEEAGLDRTIINSSGQVQLISDPSESPTKDGTNSSLTDNSDIELHPGELDVADTKAPSSKRKRLLGKVKDLVHSTKHEEVTTAPVLADARDTVSGARLVTDPPEPEKHNAKDFLRHPASTVQSKAAGQGGQQIASNIVAREISHGADVELIRAEDEVSKPGTKDEVKRRKAQVQALIKERQDMFVRWTMDRHVTAVRILPVGTVPPRSRADFKVIRADGTESMDWEEWARHSLQYYSHKYGNRYIGYNSSAPTPSKETMMPAVERLLVASAPFQTLAMSVRRVYRWENKNETLKYLCIYILLWIFDIVLPGILAAIVFFILQRHFSAPTIEDLRNDIQRIEDLTETAITLSEFIEKRGDQTWVDPLLEDVGPWLMVQLADLANLMETLRNFYEWRVPSQTAQTLGLIITGLLAVSFTPIHLLMRITTLTSGVMFFALFPIGSRFPEYRLLVSPAKWLLWNIPTHAEWSIITLQAEGQRHRNASQSSRDTNESQKPTEEPMGHQDPPDIVDGAHLKPQSDHIELSTDIYGSYHCTYDGRAGKLVLNALGVCFISSIGHNEQFSLPYANIEKIEKIVRMVSKGISRNSGEDIKLSGPNGIQYLLRNMKDRDQAFSQIVGFSPVRWQVVW